MNTTYRLPELHICVWGWYVTTTYHLDTNYENNDIYIYIYMYVCMYVCMIVCMKFSVLSFQFVVAERGVSFGSGSVCLQVSQTCCDSRISMISMFFYWRSFRKMRLALTPSNWSEWQKFLSASEIGKMFYKWIQQRSVEVQSANVWWSRSRELFTIGILLSGQVSAAKTSY